MAHTIELAFRFVFSNLRSVHVGIFFVINEELKWHLVDELNMLVSVDVIKAEDYFGW